MTMTLIYRGIVGLILLLVLKCMFEEKNFWNQVTAALVLIPLMLRLFMLK